MVSWIKAKDLSLKAKDLSLKAKAKNFGLKAKDWGLKAKANVTGPWFWLQGLSPWPWFWVSSVGLDSNTISITATALVLKFRPLSYVCNYTRRLVVLTCCDADPVFDWPDPDVCVNSEQKTGSSWQTCSLLVTHCHIDRTSQEEMLPKSLAVITLLTLLSGPC